MKQGGRVLFLDETHPVLQDDLEGMGYSCVYDPDITREQLKARIHEFTGIIVRSRIRLDQELIAAGQRLRFIGRVGSGLENVDVEFAASRGVICLNSPEGNRQAVGEHATGMLLALLHKICVADREVREGQWRREANRGTELSGKTVGIVGYGNTGSAFARCLSGFGCTLLAYDKYKQGFSNDFVRETDMDEIFREADVLSLHVPLTDETTYLADQAYLARFRKSIILINTSRGQVVNTADLVAALEEKRIRGAALDVLEYEDLSADALGTSALPANFSKLCAMQGRVVLTPHVAGWTAESAIKLASVLSGKIRGITR